MATKSGRLNIAIQCWLFLTIEIASGQKAVLPDGHLLNREVIIQFHLRLNHEQFEDLKPAGESPFGQPPAISANTGSDKETPRNTFGVDFPGSRRIPEFKGQTYSEVGLRYKGNFTQMVSARSLKKFLKLDPNRSVEGQKLDGLTMLKGHCGVSGPTSNREALSYRFFRKAGTTIICNLFRPPTSLYLFLGNLICRWSLGQRLADQNY